MGRFDLAKLKRRADDAFQGFTRGQKTMMALAVMAVIAGMLIFTRSQGGEKMSPLFNNLEAADASAVTSKLDAQNVKYKLADQGKSILVPTNDVYRLRVALNADGLPNGGSDSFALLDKEGITTSTFKQRTDYQRALAGEIGRTIEAMDNVEKAKVSLVIPTDDVFSDDSQKASASVFVRGKGTDPLSREQARSIAKLVASSVPQLSTENITITDESGRPLWFGGDDASNGLLTGEQSAQTMQFEQRKAQAIEDMLAPVVGRGNVKATVAAELDFDQKESTSAMFSNSNGDPSKDPLIAQTERSSVKYDGAVAGTVGPLGPDGQPLVPNGATSVNGVAPKYDEAKDKTTYGLNQVNSVEKTAPGKINRMTIVVAVDDKAVTAAAKGNLDNLVRQAAGYQDGRDVFAGVVPMKFDNTAANTAKKELAGASTNNDSSKVLTGLGAAAILLCLVGMGFWHLRRNRDADIEVIDLRELEAMRLAELESGVVAPHELSANERLMELNPAHDDDFLDGALGLPSGEQAEELEEDPWTALYAPPPAAALVESMEAEISGLVDSQAEDVAVLLRNWLGDRRAVSR